MNTVIIAAAQKHFIDIRCGECFVVAPTGPVYLRIVSMGGDATNAIRVSDGTPVLFFDDCKVLPVKTLTVAV
jgi:hypothetical protein